MRTFPRHFIVISLLVGVAVFTVSWVLYGQFNTTSAIARKESSKTFDDALKHDFEDHVRVLVSVVAQSSVNAILIHDMAHMGEVLQSLKSYAEVEQALIFSSGGRILHDGSESLELFNEDIRKVTGMRMVEEGIRWSLDGKHIQCVRYIYLGEEMLGGVFVQLSTSSINRKNQELSGRLSDTYQRGSLLMAERLVFVSLFLLISAACITFLVAKRLTSPIKSLAESMQRIGMGDFDSPVHADRKDEIGDLSRSMVKMADRLKQTTISRDFLDRTLHSMNDSVIVTEFDGKVFLANDSACEMFQKDRTEIVGSFITDMLDSDDINYLFQMESLKHGGGCLKSETRLFLPDGSRRCVLLSIATMEETSSLSSIIWVFHDVTDRKLLEEQLLHTAMHDALTGLPNRASVIDKIKIACERSNRDRDFNFAIIFMDLDRFKRVNDTFGHAAGDELLTKVSKRLLAEVRSLDTVSRLGGDEFVILLEDVADEHTVEDVAKRIVETLERPISLQDQTVHTSGSLGIVIGSRESYEDHEDLLMMADSAMYKAKSCGRGRFMLYDPADHMFTHEQFKLERELRDALKREQFTVFFQPIVTTGNSHVVGVEALLRWLHPEAGMIMPDKFIPIAEDSALIFELGLIALDKTIEMISKVNTNGHQLRVSLNVSGKQLNDSVHFRLLSRKLAESKSKIDLVIEVTESVLLDGKKAVNKLKAMGFLIALDDFGAGQTSLSYLTEYPLDIIKIDKSFITGLVESRQKQEVVRNVVQLSRKLGKEVVAEGVEDEVTLDFIRQVGCNYYQGYLCSPPIPYDGLETLLANQK